MGKTKLLIEKQQGELVYNIPLRIPNQYFITTGVGESDNTTHAGSYHKMLNMMGISAQNIMTYSSVLPANSNEVPKPKYLYEPRYRGAVLESIMSVCNGEEGTYLNTGIIYAKTYTDESKSINTGGLVCEINGQYPDDELEYKLDIALKEIYNNGFSHEFLDEAVIIKKSFIPQSRYGSVGVAICFLNYKGTILNDCGN